MGHIPMRECMLCRKKFYKSELLRFVKSENGIEIDENQKKSGRGAYICADCKMSDNLYKKRVLDRAFKQKVNDEVYNLLKEKDNG